MAEEDFPASVLKFPGMLDIGMLNVHLVGNLVGSGLISMTVKPGVQNIVCNFNMDNKIDRKGVKLSHDFGILTFTYFYGVGTATMEEYLPHCSEDDRDKWVSLFYDMRQLEPKSELPQSLITSAELIGEEFLSWLLSAAQQTCLLCDEELKLGDEVATLVNLNSKKLACSTRTSFGTYHVFHTPCLIRWILFFDFMIEYGSAQADPEQMMIDLECQPSSVLCPACRGTGMKDAEKGIFGKETPRISLPMAILKTEALDAYTKWMESANEASKKDDKVVGLTFSALPEDPAWEKEIIKSLHIYQADDDCY